MKEVSQDKERLKKQISELDKQLEDARKKRDRIAMAAFSAVYLVLFYIFDQKPVQLEEYFRLVLVSVVTGCMHHGINSEIYERFLSKDEYEKKRLRELKHQLHKIEERELEEVIQQKLKAIKK